MDCQKNMTHKENKALHTKSWAKKPATKETRRKRMDIDQQCIPYRDMLVCSLLIYIRMSPMRYTLISNLAVIFSLIDTPRLTNYLFAFTLYTYFFETSDQNIYP